MNLYSGYVPLPQKLPPLTKCWPIPRFPTYSDISCIRRNVRSLAEYSNDRRRIKNKFYPNFSR